MEVAVNTPFEVALRSVFSYANPVQEMPVPVVFTAPSGATHRVQAFWDGGQEWRVRFCPTEMGEWTWRTEIFNSADTGLLMKSGRFHCVSYAGDNPLYQHGSLRVAADGTYLEQADGTPFFWLADTCWNGALRSTTGDWDEYLAVRRAQGFTVIQIVMTQWRGCVGGADGQPVFTVQEGRLQVIPSSFKRLDDRIRRVNEHGMIAALVLLWALTDDDPGQTLSETDAALLGRYMRSRWDPFQVVYFLGGDGNYGEHPPGRWQRLGRAIFSEPRQRLATMHPCGVTWVVNMFHDEPWMDFHGYQSGHGDREDELRWHLAGPPEPPWELDPPKPLINLEPNYEAHPSYRDRHPFSAREVRRGVYWSLLGAPMAGVTYGHNWIWPWPVQPQVPDNHDFCGTVGPWRDAVRSPGAESMTVLRGIVDRLPWWRLRPAQELLATQPGDEDLMRSVMAAATPDQQLALVYMPVGGTARLRLAGQPRAEWLDPRTGKSQPAVMVGDQVTAPDDEDWLLKLSH